MDGPLSPAIYDTSRHVESWWEASAPPPPPRPALATETATEVAIIGAGYTGLACARRLAKHGISSVVLDAAEIGWGSSGRNGGIVCYGGTKLARSEIVRRFGAGETARSDQLQTDGLIRIRRFCETHGLSEHMRGNGELVLAHSPKAAKELAAETPPNGGTVDPFPPSGQRDLAEFGGIQLRHCFGIHPLRLVRALADATEAAGATIHPRSEVLAWERDGRQHRLVTKGGAVRANRVVLATNGFTPDRLNPAFRARTVPLISNIGVTRVLTEEERARHPWFTDHIGADSRKMLVYFQMRPEGRLLFGMRGDISGDPKNATRMRRRLEARLAQAFPGWAGIPLTHFWRGPVCATRAFTPATGPLEVDPTVYHALAWHGSGINMGNVAGRLLADVIADGDATRIPTPWRGLPPKVPLPGLRPLYVGAMMRLYALQDRFS